VTWLQENINWRRVCRVVSNLLQLRPPLKYLDGPLWSTIGDCPRSWYLAYRRVWHRHWWRELENALETMDKLRLAVWSIYSFGLQPVLICPSSPKHFQALVIS